MSLPHNTLVVIKNKDDPELNNVIGRVVGTAPCYIPYAGYSRRQDYIIMVGKKLSSGYTHAVVSDEYLYIVTEIKEG